jgi:Fe2+ or Zn2+ uptake regulation protein
MKEANTSHDRTPREMRVGKRMTPVRREIIALLKQSDTPLTLQELIVKATANEASVYRTIALLQKEGQLHDIHFPDGTHRLELRNDHHDHVICSSCGFVAHIPCAAEPVLDIRPHTFSCITGHEVIYHGLCTKCA